MKISIGTLLSGDETEITKTYALPISETAEGCTFSKDAEATVRVKNMGGYIVMTAECKADYETVCARCLTKLERTLEITVERPVAADLKSEDEEDEYLPVLNGSAIDPDELIRDEIILSLPFRSLCKDDCKGLCPKCGCNRNEKECSCQLKEPDPRWAALKKFSEK